MKLKKQTWVFQTEFSVLGYTVCSKRKGKRKMKQYQDVFKRVEKKYILSAEQYSALQRILAGRMKADEYGLHTISNIYYDTDDYALIRESLQKPVYKEKLRLRCYGPATPDSQVFVELKKKFKGVVYKRRVSMKLKDAELFLATGVMRAPMEQIHKEIAYFLKVHPASPQVYLAYDRLAMYDPEGGELRITFDRNIRFRTDELSLASDSCGTYILPPDDVLMEIKIPGAMPMWLSRALSELAIYPASFSKYGRCYQDYIMGRRLTKGGKEHAA